MTRKASLMKAVKGRTYKIWCETCDDWVSEVSISTKVQNTAWICCRACGEGIIMVQDEE